MLYVLITTTVASGAVCVLVALRLRTTCWERDLALLASQTRTEASEALQATLKRLWRAQRALVEDPQVPKRLRARLRHEVIGA